MAAAVQILPVSNLRTARRHLQKVRPPRAKDLGELHDRITSHSIAKYTPTKDGERMLSFPLRERNDAPVTTLIITTRRQLNILAQATLVQVDATYKVVPRGFGRQLLTIHGFWNGNVSR